MLYKGQQIGRKGYSLFITVVITLLATGFILAATRAFLFIPVALLFIVLAGSGVYAIIKNEKWLSAIENDIYWWKSPRWPKSQGSISLKEVSEIIIDEGIGKATFIIEKKEDKIRAPIFGDCAELKRVIETNYRAITVDYREASS